MKFAIGRSASVGCCEVTVMMLVSSNVSGGQPSESWEAHGEERKKIRRQKSTNR